MPAIIINEGVQKGLFLHLGKSPAVIGRDPAVSLQIEDEQASRRHAQVRFDEARKGYVLTDMKSANGTHLNGRAIHAESPLTDGDEIGIGTTRLLFTSETPADGASALEVIKAAGERHRSTIVRKS